MFHMKKVLMLVIVVLALGFGGYTLATRVEKVQKTDVEKQDPYVAFAMEAYDSIKKNYWEDPKGYDLANIFKLSLDKATGGTHVLATSTREATAAMISEALALASTTQAKKDLVVNMVIVATYNLQPAGRSGLLSLQQETELRQNVSNINPAKNLYDNLGIAKGSDIAAVERGFTTKQKELSASTSPEAKAALEQATYAKKVLANADTKMLYDQNQVEPTVWPKVIGNTLYLYMDKISPSTLFEFAKAVESASTTKNLDSLVLDVRGNVGGALDFAQHFLGLFSGQNQYAFDIFRQGEYQVQRTAQPKFPELDRFKEIAILTDNMTQSTAEVISAMLKRMNLAKTVGTNTRGWGTVENTYPLETVIDPNTKYTLLLVNSVTLRDDNQPIEGKGVDPNVNTGDKDWKNKVSNLFRSQSLIKAVSSEAAKKPTR